MAAGKKLAANVYVDGVLHKAGTTPDKKVADQITNPRAWDADTATADADPGTGGDGGAVVTDYSKLTVPKLRKEIEKRNEGRDDEAQLSTEGDKAALIAVLQGDDNATPGA